MPLNPTNGNMYEWVSHTWNPIRGICPHACSYCFVSHTRAARFYTGPLRLAEHELKTDLGGGNFIFVGSMVDMWAEDVDKYFIQETLQRCRHYFRNDYLFQTKNPARFEQWKASIPQQALLAVTIESDNIYRSVSPGAPTVVDRCAAFLAVRWPRKMVSVEPIMDFSPNFADWIKEISPEFVSIGADSKGHHLPEPPAGKVRELIAELEKFTKVIRKENLRRLLNG
jgi:DNA repair photolyase